MRQPVRAVASGQGQRWKWQQPRREVPAVRGARIRLALVANSEYKESTRTRERKD